MKYVAWLRRSSKRAASPVPRRPSAEAHLPEASVELLRTASDVRPGVASAILALAPPEVRAPLEQHGLVTDDDVGRPVLSDAGDEVVEMTRLAAEDPQAATKTLEVLDTNLRKAVVAVAAHSATQDFAPRASDTQVPKRRYHKTVELGGGSEIVAEPKLPRGEIEPPQL